MGYQDGSVGFPGSKVPETNAELFALPVDIIPATKKTLLPLNKKLLQSKQNPCGKRPMGNHTEADEILKKKDILFPMLVSSGGVTVSYFEWVQIFKITIGQQKNC